MLLLLVPRELRDEAEAALEAAAGVGFTEIPGVYGEGSTDPRFASRLAPGVSDLVFAAHRRRVALRRGTVPIE
jgi:hypothetical protein